MEALYRSLCRELDVLLVEIVEEMEKYVSVKIDLEKAMNDGFVNIAKTRYISGSNSVTTLQLPTEFSSIEPQATVIRNSNEQGAAIHVVNKLASDKTKNSEKEGIRKRNVVESENSQQAERSEALNSDRKMTMSADPIRLFGVLVPQSLRIAQKSFIASLDKIAAAAQVQSSLDHKLNRYSKLLATKEKLTKMSAF